MEKFRFKIFDYKKFFNGMKYFLMIMIPVIFLSFFIIHDHQDIVFVTVSLIIAAIIILVFFYLLNSSLVHDSEISLGSDGITEKNVKTGKIFKSNWENISEWKLSLAKPSTHEKKRYITIRFKESRHTISVSETPGESSQIAEFERFIAGMKQFAPASFKDKMNEEH